MPPNSFLYAKPNMIVVGSDSHTCTAGAFNAFAAGIDRTETAGLWKQGETWFRVPESIKITLNGKLQNGVYAKDLALWIIGMMGSGGADYMSIEYHGEGVKTVCADRDGRCKPCFRNGCKRDAVFPADDVLEKFLGEKTKGTWADAHAKYFIRNTQLTYMIFSPVVSAPHNVDNVKSISDVQGVIIQQAMIGTCTNGRLEDLRIAAKILEGKKVAKTVQLLIIPASQIIYLLAMEEGLIATFMKAGANILAPSCDHVLEQGREYRQMGTM